MALTKAEGNYRYLPTTGGTPFCNAVIADQGYEIVHCTLEHPLPYRAGFGLIEKHLKSHGRPRNALCGVELRCSTPYTREGFEAFNREYAELLRGWGLYQGAVGTGSTTRTNIAPASEAPAEQVLFAFAYTVASEAPRPTFVVSGAGPWDFPPDINRVQIARTAEIVEGRLRDLGLSWDLTTDIFVYMPGEFEPDLRAELIPKIGLATFNDVRWFPGLPPVVGSAIEIGTQGIRRRLRVA
jgi:hypothetical protein